MARAISILCFVVSLFLLLPAITLALESVNWPKLTSDFPAGYDGCRCDDCRFVFTQTTWPWRGESVRMPQPVVRCGCGRRRAHDQAVFMGFCSTPFVLAGIILPRMSRANRRERREAEGLCPECGYDLRGVPERGCPECGAGRSGA